MVSDSPRISPTPSPTGGPLYQAVDTIWAHGTGPQRRWAVRQLTELENPPHPQGLAVRRRLSMFRPAYYWHFGHDGHTLVQLAQCPACWQPLEFYDGGHVGWWVCDWCGIAVDGSDQDPPLPALPHPPAR